MSVGAQPAAVVGGPGLTFAVSLVPWDTRALGVPSARIDQLDLDLDADPAAAIARLADWLDGHDVRFVSCRLDSLRLRESMLLEDIGFRFVEMVYSPVLSPLGVERAGAAEADDAASGTGDASREVVIEAATPADSADLERIAASVFTTGRHVLDWRLPEGAGHERYRGWLEDALAGGSQEVLKASVDGSTVGFFVVEAQPGEGVYWHLTAVANEWQGRGIGKQLWRGMIARHRAAGVGRIETTISAHNTRVIDLYAGLGFRFTAPRSTFHWLRR